MSDPEARPVVAGKPDPVCWRLSGRWERRCLVLPGNEEPLKLRQESMAELCGLLLEREDELPPKLVSELKKFQQGHPTMRSLNIDWENDPRPYIMLAASVAAEIMGGVLSPGDRVPSQTALAKQYGVSKGTAAKAVRLLARIGAAELDGNAYWVSGRIPASAKEARARTP